MQATDLWVHHQDFVCPLHCGLDYQHTVNVSNTHYVQTDLNKKSGAMHQTLISFNIDAQGFRKTKNENPLTQEIGVTS